MNTVRRPRLTVFIPGFDDGGVERMMVNLARGAAELGVAVDFVTKRAEGTYLAALGDKVRLVPLGSDDPQRALDRYLAQAQPDALLSCKLESDAIAIASVHRAKLPTRLYVRVGTTISAHRQAHPHHFIKHWWQTRMLRRLYRQVDGILCVSQGVADDVQRISGLPRQLLHVPPNPVVAPELRQLAAEPVDHPWLAPDQPPVILGAGRLGQVKNFPLLIGAFARLRRERPCRLLILGQGKKRDELLQLGRRLGVEADLDLPGFAANPYAYMAKARLFVLSSNIEGSPNVLVEALACGTPVVATDCRSGPREILDGGRYGELVPVGDEAALAAAMRRTLEQPPSRALLEAAAQRYTLANSAHAYLRAMGLAPS